MLFQERRPSNTFNNSPIFQIISGSTAVPVGSTITRPATSSVCGRFRPASGYSVRYGSIRWHPGQKYLRTGIIQNICKTTSSGFTRMIHHLFPQQ